MVDRKPRPRHGRWLAAAIVSTVALAAHAAPLSDFYARALERDPDYLGARATYEADIRSRDLAAAAFLPQVSAQLTTDVDRYARRDPSGTLSKSYDPKVGTLRLTQPVFDLERLASKRENEVRAARAELALMLARHDLAQRLVQTTFNYLLAQDQIALARAQAEALRGQLNQVQALLASRNATRTDVADASARLELAIAQGRTAESDLEVRRLEFTRITGEPPPPDLRPLAANPTLVVPEPARPEVWIQAAKDNNFKVAVQRANVQIAEAGVDRAKAPLYPTVALVGTHQNGRTPNYFTFSERTTSLSAQINMNLFDAGIARIQTGQALSQVEKAKRDVEVAQQEAAITAGQAYWGVLNGIEQVRATEQAVKAAELTVEGTRAGIKANVKTFTDELNSLQILFQARTNLQKERYTYLVNRVQLMLAVGQDEIAIRTLLDTVSP